MIMLSQLNRFSVVDEKGETAKLVDLALALLEDDYPPVTQIFFEKEGILYREEWEAIMAYEPRQKRIVLDDLAHAAETSYDAINGDVLVNDDILDSLIIDLTQRTTTRATDLQFDDDEGILRLRAADTGLGAMLRRITRGRYRRVNQKVLYDWKYVEFLRGDPKAVDNGEGYRLRIGRLPAGEIALLADYIPYLHAAELIKLLPDPKAADVLEAMSIERQLQVFEELEEDQALNLLRSMASDHVADLLGRLRVADMKKYLYRLPKPQSERIIQLLRYPEDTVGGVMINDMFCFGGERTIAEVREELGRRITEFDFISMMFVVDDEDNRRLRGVVSLPELLAYHDGDEPIEKIMNPFLETLRPFDSAEDAAYRIVSGQLTAMPVTDTDGLLLGAMTFVAAIPQLVPATNTLRSVRIFS